VKLQPLQAADLARQGLAAVGLRPCGAWDRFLRAFGARRSCVDLPPQLAGEPNGAAGVVVPVLVVAGTLGAAAFVAHHLTRRA
jgi:hypothetical protein